MTTLTLTIMRALPGAGKTYHATRIAAETGAGIGSADTFPGLYGPADENGRPTYNVALAGSAHGACFRHAVESLQSGQSVIVDNTNLSLDEIAPYILLAQAYQAEPKVLTVACDPEVAHARNTHGVPWAVVKTPEGDVVKTYSPSESIPEGSEVLGGFVEMIGRFQAFQAPFHWQFIPGFESIRA